jgi:hypothetical protein
LGLSGRFASRDLSAELSEPLVETIAAGASPTFVFILEKCCGNACASTICSEFSSSPAPSANKNANALFLHVTEEHITYQEKKTIITVSNTGLDLADRSNCGELPEVGVLGGEDGKELVH